MVTIIKLGWHGINFPFSDVSDQVNSEAVNCYNIPACLEALKGLFFSVFPQKLIVTKYLSR